MQIKFLDNLEEKLKMKGMTVFNTEQVDTKKQPMFFGKPLGIQRYDSYKESSLNMSYLRFGYLVGVLGGFPETILDCGYGNGDFLKVASKSCRSFGYEVNGYPIPTPSVEVRDIYETEVEVTCFFDVLEHFEDIYEIKNLKSKYIYISVPNCLYHSDEWFKEWRHRREDEHLWHFNEESLVNFFNEIGYKKLSSSNIEDSIRGKLNGDQNILTCIFKKNVYAEKLEPQPHVLVAFGLETLNDAPINSST